MVVLRKAVPSDMEILFKWANDPLVRKNSFNSEPISYETHKAWFKRMMDNPEIHQYILVDGGLEVGQIRLNVDGREAEIGYSIAPEYRGMGYGKKILQLIKEEVHKDLPQISTLVAKVKPDNNASNKAFASEGYGLKYHCYTLSIE